MFKYLIPVFFIYSINGYCQLSFKSSEISDAAIEIIDPNIDYVPGWVEISYPNGDVDPTTGVCTDLVIRTLRKLGFDLKKS